MKVRKMPFTRGGIRKESRKWYAEWVDATGVLRRLPLFTDRKASEECARKVERLDNLRGAGAGELPPELSRFVEGMPDAIRVRLGAYGILGPHAMTAGRTLEEHLAAYKAYLEARGRNPRYVLQAVNQVRRVAGACGWLFWSDVSAGRLDQWLNDLRDGEDGAADRTANGYLVAVKAFSRWMVKDRRASASPVAHLDKRDERPSFERGPFTTDEMRRLIRAARDGGRESFGMSGTERATLYRFAAETGFRAGELRQLTVARVDLDADPPTATAAKWTTKGRKSRTVPLRADTAGELRRLCAGKLPGATVFRLPDSTHTAEMIRADMRAAEIPEMDERGRKRDFHSLRHTMGTFLGAAGVNPKVAQSVLGHSDVNLTMGIYTHVLRDDETQAVAALPDLSVEQAGVARATGTIGGTAGPTLKGAASGPAGLSPCLSPRCDGGRGSVELGGVKGGGMRNAKSPEDQGFSGETSGSGRGWIRTSEGRAIRITE